MKQNYSLKWYFYRWFTCWANFASGLIGIFTLGFYWPDWDLWTEGKFLDVTEEIN